MSGVVRHIKLSGPIPEDELHNIADESSQSERRADEAERELMEWKKMKFMEQHLGDEFAGLVVSVTKFGMFVELNDMFIEGLVPLASLADDHYLYHENTRQIIGQRNSQDLLHGRSRSASSSIASTACSTASSSLSSRIVQYAQAAKAWPPLIIIDVLRGKRFQPIALRMCTRNCQSIV